MFAAFALLAANAHQIGSLNVCCGEERPAAVGRKWSLPLTFTPILILRTDPVTTLRRAAT